MTTIEQTLKRVADLQVYAGFIQIATDLLTRIQSGGRFTTAEWHEVNKRLIELEGNAIYGGHKGYDYVRQAWHVLGMARLRLIHNADSTQDEELISLIGAYADRIVSAMHMRSIQDIPQNDNQ